jgi:hypothetical protein
MHSSRFCWFAAIGHERCERAHDPAAALGELLTNYSLGAIDFQLII